VGRSTPTAWGPGCSPGDLFQAYAAVSGRFWLAQIAIPEGFVQERDRLNVPSAALCAGPRR